MHLSFYDRFYFFITLGGLTGVVLANSGLDIALMILIMLLDTFIMFFYGCRFQYFCSLYFWFEHFQGFKYNENLGIVHFYVTLVLIYFFSNAFLGLAGMPRRIPDYADSFYVYNAISSASMVTLLDYLFF